MQAEGVQCARARPFPGKGGHPLQWQGLGMWGRSPLAPLATRDTWGLGRSGCAPCVGGERSGKIGNLTALAGLEHQVGDGPGAPAWCGGRELCSTCVLSPLWVGPRRGGGEVPPGSLQLLLRALLCGVDL